MNRLQKLAALTDDHFDVLLVVRDLEQTRGRGARVAEVAKLCSRSEAETRGMLRELATAGYLSSDGPGDDFSVDAALPILGDVG